MYSYKLLANVHKVFGMKLKSIKNHPNDLKKLRKS